jgi:ABC-type multidrug transport system ATPase subunit
MLGFIAKLTPDTTVAIVAAQAVLVILTVFGGGSFIAWDKCPDYWRWLQEMSIFTQASRAAIMGTNDYVDYTCQLQNNVCVGPLGDVFTCDVYYNTTTGECKVSGRSLMHTLQGTREGESKWIPFGYLVLIFATFRLLQLALLYFSADKMRYAWQQWIGGVTAKSLLETKLGLRRVEGQLNAFIAQSNKTKSDDPEGAPLLGDDGSSQKPSPIVVTGVDPNARVFSAINDMDFANNTDFIHPLAHGACLEWKNLSVVLPQNGKRLVDSVSGVALPGRILALMGPSGAGKTTLLNALSNRAPYARLEGEVFFAGRPFAATDLVYVPQFDEFNPNLTVMEQIGFVGEMKCQDVREMRNRLHHLLDILGLSMKANIQCKELTSGELKRVSVGMGMISNPNVLFLDEPTTGLDSSAAYSIVKYLSELSAATKVVVIMTIHQPAPMVFDLLQDLYLLELGRLAFFGPLQSTRKYFGLKGFACPVDINPADFFLDLVSAPPAKQLETMGTNLSNDEQVKFAAEFQDKTWTNVYMDSLLFKNMQKLLTATLEMNQLSGEKKEAKPAPGTLSRFLTLVEFFSRYYWRDIGFYHLRIVFLVIVAIFIGTLFLNLQTKMTNIPQYSGAVFFNIWTALFSAVAATGLLAADRRQAIEQVKNAVMTPSVYCLAQFVVSAPFNFVASVIYQAVFHWLININPHGESFIFAIFITTGHLMLMEAFMLTVVAVLKNAMLSVTFAMCVLGYLFLFAGFFIPVRNMPPSIFWISYVTPTHVSISILFLPAILSF